MMGSEVKEQLKLALHLQLVPKAETNMLPVLTELLANIQRFSWLQACTATKDDHEEESTPADLERWFWRCALQHKTGR
jgi:hypothetical protein